MTARLPAGSGQIICSRERTDHVLPTGGWRPPCSGRRVRLACPRPIHRRQGRRMRRGPKPAKSKEAKPPGARKSSKDAGAKVRDLEKRLVEAEQREAETLKREAEALKLQTEAQEQQTATAEI